MKYLIILLSLFMIACEEGSNGGTVDSTPNPLPIEIIPDEEIIDPGFQFNVIQEITEESCNLLADWQDGLIDDADAILLVEDIIADTIWWRFDKDGVIRRHIDVGGDEATFGGFITDETFSVGQCMFHVVSSSLGIDEIYWETVRFY